MHFQRFERGYQVRFESGESVVEPLLRWLAAEQIGYATLSGIGAVSSARVSYLDAETAEYEPHQLDEQLEILSLIGNATIKENEPFLHLHVALGRRDLSMIGGHVNELVVHPNLEVAVRTEPVAIQRVLQAESGQWLMDLPEHAS